MMLLTEILAPSPNASAVPPCDGPDDDRESEELAVDADLIDARHDCDQENNDLSDASEKLSVDDACRGGGRSNRITRQVAGQETRQDEQDRHQNPGEISGDAAEPRCEDRQAQCFRCGGEKEEEHTQNTILPITSATGRSTPIRFSLARMAGLWTSQCGPPSKRMLQARSRRPRTHPTRRSAVAPRKLGRYSPILCVNCMRGLPRAVAHS